MGKGFYHVTVMPEMNIDKIIESSPLTWHNARAYVFKWDVDFDTCKANAIIGNPTVITDFSLVYQTNASPFSQPLGKVWEGNVWKKHLQRE